MDYMLLKDGSFIPIPGEPTSGQIQELLRTHGGVAHYWKNPPGNWYYLKPDTPLHKGGIQINTYDVPEIIRLAAMLE